jgi:hypothetical protein
MSQLYQFQPETSLKNESSKQTTNSARRIRVIATKISKKERGKNNYES